MKRFEGIQAVTYDCWGTMLRDKDPEGAMDIRLSALNRFLDLDEDAARSLLKEAWAKHDEAWKQVETFGPGRMAAYCLETNGIEDDDSIRELSKAFEEASLEGGVEAADGVVDAMTKLRAEGIRIGVICDTGFSSGRVVRSLLEEQGIAELVDVFCFSDEIGVPKPGNEIFAKALAELGVRPPEAIHIGDLKRTDIAGAHDVGMHAIRYRGVHDDKTDATEAECVIDRHEQLLEAIGLSG
jgi:HAD superfamily hydrolase (TIGR01549 family)